MLAPIQAPGHRRRQCGSLFCICGLCGDDAGIVTQIHPVGSIHPKEHQLHCHLDCEGLWVYSRLSSWSHQAGLKKAQRIWGELWKDPRHALDQLLIGADPQWGAQQLPVCFGVGFVRVAQPPFRQVHKDVADRPGTSVGRPQCSGSLLVLVACLVLLGEVLTDPS